MNQSLAPDFLQPRGSIAHKIIGVVKDYFGGQDDNDNHNGGDGNGSVEDDIKQNLHDGLGGLKDKTQPLENHLEDKLHSITTQLSSSMDVPDFYSFYAYHIYQGNYLSSMTVKNATKCSQMVLTGNSSNNTDSTLTELISLWPSSVTDGIKQIQEGSNFLLIFYSLSLAISVPDLTVKSAWLWISISSHHHLSKFNQSKPTESPLRHRDSLLKWQQFLTLLLSITLLVVSATITHLSKLASAKLNSIGANYGMEARTGECFLVFTWVILCLGDSGLHITDFSAMASGRKIGI
ncbi:MAG: hypothetical protein MMC23_009823 [Stictis urceolatum]|nr:hypothetical protein [Stictis urceolata]